MLKGGKMGRLRRVFEVILGCNVINRHFSDVICRIFATIRGLRPANLECVTPVDDNLERVIEHKKKTTIIFKGLDGVRQYAVLFEQCVQSSTRVRKAQVVTRQTNPIGRSMIEMLGVLAIIGVLSVGGIAGYSKAMEKYKINKTIEQFNYLIQGMLEHTDSLRDKSNSSRQYGLVDVVQALNLVPETWERVNHIRLTDEMGDTIQPFIRNGKITIDFYLGGKTVVQGIGDLSYAFSDKLCREIVQNVFYPLHSAARAAHIFTNKIYSYYGNSLCADGRKCLKDITPIEINNICKACDIGKQSCILVLEM